MSSNSISMSSNNLLNSCLDSLMSDNSIFNMVLNSRGSSSISMMGLSNNSWGMCNLWRKLLLSRLGLK